MSSKRRKKEWANLRYVDIQKKMQNKYGERFSLYDNTKIWQINHGCLPSEEIYSVLFYNKPLVTFYPNGDIELTTHGSKSRSTLTRLNLHIPHFSGRPMRIETIRGKWVLCMYDPDRYSARIEDGHKNKVTSDDFVILVPFQDGIILHPNWLWEKYAARALHGLLTERSPEGKGRYPRIIPRRTHAN